MFEYSQDMRTEFIVLNDISFFKNIQMYIFCYFCNNCQNDLHLEKLMPEARSSFATNGGRTFIYSLKEDGK